MGYTIFELTGKSTGPKRNHLIEDNLFIRVIGQLIGKFLEEDLACSRGFLCIRLGLVQLIQSFQDLRKTKLCACNFFRIPGIPLLSLETSLQELPIIEISNTGRSIDLIHLLRFLKPVQSHKQSTTCRITLQGVVVVFATYLNSIFSYVFHDLPCPLQFTSMVRDTPKAEAP